MTERTTPDLEPDHSLAEVATALGMSTRWVRQRIADGAEHQRYGHKIRFTPAQVQALRESHAANTQPANVVTTGKKRSK